MFRNRKFQVKMKHKSLEGCVTGDKHPINQRCHNHLMVRRFQRRLLTFYLLSVRGTSVVCVDLLARRALIEAHKAVQQVIAGGIVIVASGDSMLGSRNATTRRVMEMIYPV
jgi:hypothetical protein